MQNFTHPFEDKVGYFHSNIKSFHLVQYNFCLMACAAGSYILYYSLFFADSTCRGKSKTKEENKKVSDVPGKMQYVLIFEEVC
jgi:hypothetical protein